MLLDDRVTGPYRYYQTGKPYKAVTAVFTTIREALARGEKVQIVGFGTFKLVKRCYLQSHTDPITNRYFGPRVVKNYKDIVVFTPSRDLKRFVNEGIKDDEP